MTKAEADLKAAGLMIPQPFAAGDNTHLSAYKPIDVDPVSNDVNFVEGFTAAFSAPTSQNGRYVTRQEMNAIGHLASVNEFKRQVGGIVTYNPTLATKIGGYPKYAVLEYLNGLNYYRVISLVENNLVNFTEVGVDGVNWAFCEQGIVTDSNPTETALFEIPAGTVYGGTYQVIPLRTFTSAKSGYITFIGSGSIGTSTAAGFTGIVATDGTTNPTDSLGTVLYGFGSASVGSVTYHSLNATFKAVTANQQYSLWVVSSASSPAVTFANGAKITL